jgi:hypothetical protein
MIMAGSKGRLNHVESCQLGKIGSNGVALKINFVMGNPETNQGPRHSAEFGMSRQAARGLADALMRLLDDPMPAKAEQMEH